VFVIVGFFKASGMGKSSNCLKSTSGGKLVFLGLFGIFSLCGSDRSHCVLLIYFVIYQACPMSKSLAMGKCKFFNLYLVLEEREI
jgi:hypothetical protein